MPRHRLRFGVSLGGESTPGEALETATIAEELGFDFVTLSDHFVDTGPPRASVADPWIMEGAIAERTKKVAIGQSVTDYQRNHPAKLAHMIATLDTISGGRAMLGLGAGEAMNIVRFGLPWLQPKLRLEGLGEAASVIKLLWSSSRDSTVSFHGKFFRLERAWLDQTPLQKPHPPIWLGILGARPGLELVGRVGDGWIPWLNSPETYPGRLSIIREAAEGAGRSFDSIDRVVALQATISRDPTVKRGALASLKTQLVMESHQLRLLGLQNPLEERSVYQNIEGADDEIRAITAAARKIPDAVSERGLFVVGSASEIVDLIDRYVKIGATHIIVRRLGAPNITLRQTIKDIAHRVMPHFR